MQALSHKHNMKEAKIHTFSVSKYLSPPSGAICTRKNNAQTVMCMWANITKKQTNSRTCKISKMQKVKNQRNFNIQKRTKFQEIKKYNPLKQFSWSKMQQRSKSNNRK